MDAAVRPVPLGPHRDAPGPHHDALIERRPAVAQPECGPSRLVGGGDAANPWLGEALDRTAPDPVPGRVQALVAAGILAIFQGAYPHGAAFSREASALAGELGAPLLVGQALMVAGFLASRQGDHARAEALLVEAHACLSGLGDRVPGVLADTCTVLLLGVPSIRRTGGHGGEPGSQNAQRGHRRPSQKRASALKKGASWWDDPPLWSWATMRSGPAVQNLMPARRKQYVVGGAGDARAAGRRSALSSRGRLGGEGRHHGS